MISKQIVYIGDFAADAEKLKLTFGTTDRFSTGNSGLDEYLGSGFGRLDGYEVVLLYGSTGIGKSLVALNMIKPAIQKGERVGLLVLEDDAADVSVRLSFIMDKSAYERMNAERNVLCLPKDALSKSWKLDELLGYIEDWFVKQKVDLILLDHLQFAFEGAEAIRGENEYIAQRVFMQKLNQLMKRVKKTIILVSHTNKGLGKGMDKIVGSGSIAQAATKVIEVSKDEGNTILTLHKSRFTKTPDNAYAMKLEGTRLKGLEPDVQPTAGRLF
jgi:predicted ATP-dependent serine protease